MMLRLEEAVMEAVAKWYQADDTGENLTPTGRALLSAAAKLHAHRRATNGQTTNTVKSSAAGGASCDKE
jgi:uncharacterized protein (DUF111 family)